MGVAVFRTLGAIVAAFVLALILVIGVEFFSAVVYPVPPDFSGSMEEMCAHVARYPHWVLAVVVPLWGFTAFASTWTAGRIGNRASAIIIGLLLTAAASYNVWMLPYPTWFKAAILLVVPVACVIGDRWACRRGKV